MVQASELDTLLALRILIEILRLDEQFTLPGEKTRRVIRPARI